MKEKNKKKMLLKLFLSTLYLSAFTFGGGYVIVTLMKKKFVDQYHWIEENEMLDLVLAHPKWHFYASTIHSLLYIAFSLTHIPGYDSLLPP
jgi:chromate transporter